MAQTTISVGMVLVLLGVSGYLGTGRASVTALIPAFFGIVLIILGVVAARSSQRGRMIAMHIAAVVGLLGIIGPAMQALPKLGALFAGEAERPVAIVMQLLMMVISAVFVALCVRSFIAARRSRPPGEA
jgi:uncharacterized membrane protein